MSSTPKSTRAIRERIISKMGDELVGRSAEVFKDLTPIEKENVLKWMMYAGAQGQTENIISESLWAEDYTTKPVDIEQFIMDDDYLGLMRKDLHPNLVNGLKVIFGPSSEVVEVILTGSTGWGKTTTMGIAIAYVIYRMSCLISPAEFYGLLPKSKIVLGIYSVTKRQVADTCFYDVMQYMDAAPYFRDQFPRKADIDSKIVFTKQPIDVTPGSRSLHSLGLNLFGFALDEANFFNTKEEKETGKMLGQAYEIYNSASARILTRFTQKGGTIPGICLLGSSRNATTSFIEERVKKVKPDYKEGDRGLIHKNVYVMDYNVWDCKPKDRFRKQRFRVEVGDRTNRSRVLKANEVPRRASRVVEVPMDFLRRFIEDTDQSLRDIAGVGTANSSPFIFDTDSITACYRSSLKHPFSKEDVTITTEDSITVQDYLRMRDICWVQESRMIPKLNPTASRYVHFDLSVTGDACGFAMCHHAGTAVGRDLSIDGVETVVQKPVLVVDMMLRIRPPNKGRIDFTKLRSFVLYLRNFWPIRSVTTDGFQSEYLLQLMRKDGFNSGVQSVDRTSEPYKFLREAHFERRLVMYQYDPYTAEMLDLTYDVRKDKVDHPMKTQDGRMGRKDVADAVCGCTYTCMKDPEAAEPTNHNVTLEIPSEVDKLSNPDPSLSSRPIDIIPKKTPSVNGVPWDKIRNQKPGS